MEKLIFALNFESKKHKNAEIYVFLIFNGYGLEEKF